LTTVLSERAEVHCVHAISLTQRAGNVIAFSSTLDNPRIQAAYQGKIVGAKFRLDHDYIDVIASGKGPSGATLHGGRTPFDPAR